MVCPDLQGLLLPVQQPDSVVLLVLQQADLPDASLLPLASIMIKSVQLALAATHACTNLSLNGARPTHNQEHLDSELKPAGKVLSRERGSKLTSR